MSLPLHPVNFIYLGPFYFPSDNYIDSLTMNLQLPISVLVLF